MDLHELAVETAEKQAASEAEAFERALIQRKECDDLRIEQIADYYGFPSQSNMLSEESAEYIVALNKYHRGNIEAYENIKEEVADVLIMARQLRYLLGYEDIDRIVNSKLDRQMRRIADEVS